MRYIPARRFTPGSNLTPTRVVIHGTTGGTACGYAVNVAVWFQSPQAGGSAHLTADPCEVVRSLHDHVIAHHAPPNTRSLGIELCDPVAGPPERWDSPEHTRMLLRAAAEVRHWCQLYGIPMRKIGPVELRAGAWGVCGHIDVSQAWRLTDHWDPGPTFPWPRFMAMVRSGSDVIDTEAEEMTPDQDRKLSAAAASSQRAADQAQSAALYAARAADQAPKAALYAAGADRKATVALSWLAHGGIPEGVTSIYRRRLGRTPDAAGLAAWAQVATEHTYDEVDARIADTDEARARASA